MFQKSAKNLPISENISTLVSTYQTPDFLPGRQGDTEVNRLQCSSDFLVGFHANRSHIFFNEIFIYVALALLFSLAESPLFCKVPMTVN